MRQAKIGCSFAYARRKKHHMEPSYVFRRCTVGTLTLFLLMPGVATPGVPIAGKSLRMRSHSWMRALAFMAGLSDRP
jgi:hypothetical protein